MDGEYEPQSQGSDDERSTNRATVSRISRDINGEMSLSLKVVTVKALRSHETSTVNMSFSLSLEIVTVNAPRSHETLTVNSIKRY